MQDILNSIYAKEMTKLLEIVLKFAIQSLRIDDVKKIIKFAK